MPYKYSFKNYEKEHMSRAAGLSIAASLKKSIEICNNIRNKPLDKCKKILNDAIEQKRPIPFTRFNKDVGHKKSIGPGRYAVKTCKEILNIIESAESNAQFKGLNSKDLIIKYISANKAPGAWHFGRQRRRKMKRAHIEVVLEESKRDESKKTGKLEKKEKPKGNKDNKK